LPFLSLSEILILCREAAIFYEYGLPKKLE